MALAGCGAQLYERGATFQYQDQVGIAKLTVVSVVRWEDVEQDLLPNFKLEAEKALQQVARSVRSEDETYLSSLRGALKLTLPGAPAPQVPQQSAKGASGAEESGGQASSERSVSKGQAPSDTVPDVSASIQYRLAVALFQEVQLLRNYIRHVAREKDSEAFLVSMDVGGIPLRRAEVDAEVLVTFIGRCPTAGGDACLWTPAVVPVILSDDVELNRHSRQVQNALQLSLAIAGAIKGIGVGSNIESARQELLRTLGRDINSLQVVTSATPNSLAVRFGAGYGVETRYALFPQTRRIHALLFVPKEHVGKPLQVLSHSLFRYVDGKDIQIRPQSDVLRLNTEDFIAHTGIPVTEKDLEKLWKYYHESSGDYFIRFWKERNLEYVVPVAWAEIARLSTRSRWSYNGVPLPAPKPDELDLPGEGREPYAAFDDGRAIRIRIGGKRLSPEPGRWKFSVSANGETIHVLPTSVKSISDRLMELEFPPAALDAATIKLSPAIVLTYENNAGKTRSVPLRYVKVSEAPSPKPAIRVLSDAIATEADGSGEIIVEIVSDDVKKLTLDSTAASFAGDGGKTVAVFSVDRAVEKSVVVPFRHLVPGRSVIIVARDSDDEELYRVLVPVIDSGRRPK